MKYSPNHFQNWRYHRLQRKVLMGFLGICFAICILSLAFMYASKSHDVATGRVANVSIKFDPVFGIEKQVEHRRLFINSFANLVSYFSEKLDLPSNETLFKSYTPPIDYAHWPRISNGVISTLPYHTSVFVSGIFNGARIAQIPSFLNQRVLDALVDGTTLSVSMRSEYSFHVASGVFMTNITSPLFEINQLFYCHKKISNLMTMEIFIKRPSNLAPRVAPSLTLRIQKPRFNSPDMTQLHIPVAEGQSVYGNDWRGSVSQWYGQTKLPEWSGSELPEDDVAISEAYSYVSVHYDDVPHVLQLPRGHSQQRWTFLAAYGSNSRESLKAYQRGKALAAEDRLIDSHAEAWTEVWNNGRLQIRGNSTLNAALLSSQYALFSEIPSHNRDDQQQLKFSGLGACGLAPLNMSACEYGLIVNDQEYAIIPTLISLQPALAKKLVFSRISHLTSAHTNSAKIHRKIGAAFPWLTANSGLELHSNKQMARYNKLSSGLVASAMRIVWPYLNRADKVYLQTFVDVAVAIAQFYAEHISSHRLPALGNSGATADGGKIFDLPHVIGPYDLKFVVNNSISVNLLAKLSLSLAARLLPSKTDERISEWVKMSERLTIPTASTWWDVPKIHDGFTYSADVRLSDFVFLRQEFTSNSSLKPKTLSKTLQTYLPLYGEQSAFGLALFTANYLAVGDHENASLMLERMLRQFTSNYYRSLADLESNSTKSLRKKNSAYWVWLCGPNIMSMTATNCLASASAMPYSFTWGWLGFLPMPINEIGFDDDDKISVASFSPTSPLPAGVSSIELINWQLPSFGNADSLSLSWNGSVAKVKLNGFKVKTDTKCFYACLVDQTFYKFTENVQTLNLRPSHHRKSLPIKISCVKPAQI